MRHIRSSVVCNSSRVRGLSAIGLLVAATCLLFQVPAAASTIHVPADQPTIQQGIDAAAEGDTVLVAPGTYVGPLNRALQLSGNDIVLRSEAGPSGTILDLEGIDCGFKVSGDISRQTRIEGFTVRNGYGEYYAGAMECWGSPTVVNCVFEDCSNRPNDFAYTGGVLVGGPARFEFCNFVRNTSGYNHAGAVYVSDYGSARAEFFVCRFVDNVAFRSGGAIAALAPIELVGCTFENNVATNLGGGAIIAAINDNAGLTVRSCRFLGNEAATTGGAVELIGSGIIEETVITGNVANQGAGVAVDGSVDIRRSTIAANRANTSGGGLFLLGGTGAVLDRSIVFDNCATVLADQVLVRGIAITTLVAQCSDIDSSGVEVVSGDLSYLGDNLFVDPLFCAPDSCSSAPTIAGYYRVDANSPCTPENSPCGLLIGALPGDCEAGTGSGACCFDDGTCALLTPDECSFAIGTFLGVGTVCVGSSCPAAGACCLDDGSCTILTEESCVSRDGTWWGDDAPCETAPCLSAGGCCLSDDTCVVLTALECVAQGGNYLGNDVPCAGPCGPNAGGVLLVHANPSIAYTVDNDGYCGEAALENCEEARSTIFSSPGSAHVFSVLAAFPAGAVPHLNEVYFGLDYDGSEVGILEWANCSDYEMPLESWPEPGTGTSVHWISAREDALIEVYWFAAQNYYGNPQRVELTGYPGWGGLGAFRDADADRWDQVVCAGVLGFETPGENCCPWSPVGACCFPDAGCSVLSEEECIAENGNYEGVGTVCYPDLCSPTAVPETDTQSGTKLLTTVSPNPSRSEVKFSFTLPERESVRLRVFDSSGRLVETLLDGTAGPGSQTIHWTLDKTAPSLASGVYFARLEAGRHRESATFVVRR